MLGIEEKFYMGLLNIFGGNIFFLALFACGFLIAVVLLLRLPLIIVWPLIAMVMIFMMSMPVVGDMIKLLFGLVAGIMISIFLYRIVMGGG